MSYHFQHYKALLKRCGLPDIRWHDLRRTFCTLLLKNDYSPKAVSKIMGHAKEIITLDVYADNAQMIADGVAELQPFIDDVLPDEKPLYNEVTDVSVDVAFYFEYDDETINNDTESVIKMREYDFEGREERIAG